MLLCKNRLSAGTRITVRYLGKRYTATRDTANECEQWAAKKLLELQSEQANPESEKIHISFYALFEQYYQEEGRKMKSARLIVQILKCLKKKNNENIINIL